MIFFRAGIPHNSCWAKEKGKLEGLFTLLKTNISLENWCLLEMIHFLLNGSFLGSTKSSIFFWEYFLIVPSVCLKFTRRRLGSWLQELPSRQSVRMFAHVQRGGSLWVIGMPRKDCLCKLYWKTWCKSTTKKPMESVSFLVELPPTILIPYKASINFHLLSFHPKKLAAGTWKSPLWKGLNNHLN